MKSLKRPNDYVVFGDKLYQDRQILQYTKNGKCAVKNCPLNVFKVQGNLFFKFC